MKVAFILPPFSRKPVGGYRVVFEYANRLSQKGHSVYVYFLTLLPNDEKISPFKKIRLKIKRIKPGWFRFSAKVTLRLLFGKEEIEKENFDSLVATAWRTAYFLKEVKSKSEKFYLIQHYEIWDGEAGLVNASYKLGLKNIVISKWLQEKLSELGAPVFAYIPNGINFDIFKLKAPIDERDRFSICSMYHHYRWKGVEDCIKALEIVRKELPIKVVFFGTLKKAELPDWIKYVYNPSQKQLCNLYNSNSVFVHSSWSEGFPLPPAEAMACGCAVVATNSLGILEYAKNGYNALICAPKDEIKLAENLKKVILDNDLRINLAKNGHQVIRNFTWDKAVEKFEKALNG